MREKSVSSSKGQTLNKKIMIEKKVNMWEIRSTTAKNFVEDVLKVSANFSREKSTSICLKGQRNKVKVQFNSISNPVIEIGECMLSKSDMLALNRLPNHIDEIRLKQSSNINSASMLIKEFSNIHRLEFNSSQCCVNIICASTNWSSISLHKATFYRTRVKPLFYKFDSLVDLSLIRVSFKTKNFRKRIFKAIGYAINLQKLRIVTVSASNRLKRFTVKGRTRETKDLRESNILALFEVYLPNSLYFEYSNPWVSRKRHSIFVWNQFYKSRVFRSLGDITLPRIKFGTNFLM